MLAIVLWQGDMKQTFIYAFSSMFSNPGEHNLIPFDGSHWYHQVFLGVVINEKSCLSFMTEEEVQSISQKLVKKENRIPCFAYAHSILTSPLSRIMLSMQRSISYFKQWSLGLQKWHGSLVPEMTLTPRKPVWTGIIKERRQQANILGGLISWWTQ